MDFGRHNLEKDGINDLQLICRGGEIVRASSFPLAMNSLVMSDLVGDQGMKELDVEEFSHSSVLCFVEACYTGTVEVTRENFREVNKLSAVFKVQWLIEEFSKFYKDLCLDLNSESLELAMFLFQEAAYIIRKRNDRDLFDSLSPMITGFPTLRFSLLKAFISSDPNEQEYVNTDLCLSMATINEAAVLYEWLIGNFEVKPHPVVLNDIEKRFLSLPSLKLCFQADQPMYQRLLTVVQQSLSKDDLVSVFETFGSVALSPPAASSTSNSQNSITYPIEIPLGECNSFLDSVKVLVEEPKISSCFQFVSSLNYCCKMFGDTSSPELIDSITTGMEKRRNNTTHGLLGVSSYIRINIHQRSVWSAYPSVKGILDQYIMSTEEKVSESEKHHSNMWYETLDLPVQLPLAISTRQILNLHYGGSSCPENPAESRKWCKVAVDISMTIKDYETWPDITIQLVEDQAVLDAERNAHFHQDPEFLQYISVSQLVDVYDKQGIDFNFCIDRGTNRDPFGNQIDEFYGSLHRDGKTSLVIRWPVF
eukprot:sb/3463730/